jgi:hypothetical protein
MNTWEIGRGDVGVTSRRRVSRSRKFATAWRAGAAVCAPKTGISPALEHTPARQRDALVE